MTLVKKKLTEQEAAEQFVCLMVKEAGDSWPNVHKMFKERYKEMFALEDEKMAVLDFVLAVIAYDLQAVKNLFPREQAERIKKWVFMSFDVLGVADYAVYEVQEYSERFQKEIENIDEGGDPRGAISSRLI